MKQVSGYVLVKETNAGIPNLIVTAYDSGNSIGELTRDRSSGGGLSLGNLGKRIGSVSTAADGSFSLKGEDLEFQGNESRPDLLLVIFAPEDVQGLSSPYPLPPEQRVLYVSALPRADAGAEEAFVIRLLQEQLDHFSIAASTPVSPRGADDGRLADALGETWDFRDRLKDRLGARMREEQERSAELQDEARDKLRGLSAIPVYLRNDSLTNSALLIHGKKDLADNLQRKQEQAIANGLQRLQARHTVLHLRLTEDELADLGLRIEGDEIAGEIDAAKLTEKVRAKINGLDLIRKRGLNNPSPEELIAKYSLPGDPARASDGQEPAGNEVLEW